MRWENFLDVALRVASDADPSNPTPVCDCLADVDSEARYRIAISRSYYAALGTCREHIKTTSVFPLSKTAQEHDEIRRFFLESEDSSEKQIGRWLGELKEARRKADYDWPSGADWKKEAGKAFRYADTICQKLG